MTNISIENEREVINVEITVQEQRVRFFETINQQFLSCNGYGAGAYLSPAAVLSLFNLFLIQNLSETDFIRAIIRRPISF